MKRSPLVFVSTAALSLASLLGCGTGDTGNTGEPPSAQAAALQSGATRAEPCDARTAALRAGDGAATCANVTWVSQAEGERALRPPTNTPAMRINCWTQGDVHICCSSTLCCYSGPSVPGGTLCI